MDPNYLMDALRGEPQELCVMTLANTSKVALFVSYTFSLGFGNMEYVSFPLVV